MATNVVRAGFHTVTPYLIVPDVTNMIEFLKQVFGATELFRTTGSAGGMHAEVRIGDSMVMIGGGAGGGGPWQAMLYLYLDDVDTVYQRALAAGATSLAVPTNETDGDRRAGVQDPYGNHWYIATHKQDVPL